MIDKEKVINGLRFTIGMILFDPLTGSDILPDRLNKDDKITYEACRDAIALLEQEKPKAKDISDYTPGHWEFVCSKCHASIGAVEGGTLFRFCPGSVRIVEPKWRLNYERHDLQTGGD